MRVYFFDRELKLFGTHSSDAEQISMMPMPRFQASSSLEFNYVEWLWWIYSIVVQHTYVHQLSLGHTKVTAREHNEDDHEGLMI